MKERWPTPRWLDSSVGRALHQYHRGHGFESRSGLNFFQTFLFLSDFHIFLYSSNIWSFIYSLAELIMLDLITRIYTFCFISVCCWCCDIPICSGLTHDDCQPCWVSCHSCLSIKYYSCTQRKTTSPANEVRNIWYFQYMGSIWWHAQYTGENHSQCKIIVLTTTPISNCLHLRPTHWSSILGIVNTFWQELSFTPHSEKL